MDLEITGRGTQVTQKLRQQAEAALARIERVTGPKANAKVVLTCEKNRCEVEVTVHHLEHDLSARCEDRDIEKAMRDAFDKVETQVVKTRKKSVTNMHHPDQDATGSVRLQSSDDVDLKGNMDAESKRLAQSKTSVGKAVALIDDGELHDEQDVAVA